MARRESPSAVAARIRRRADRQPGRRRRRGLPPPQVLVRAPGLEVAAGDRDLPFHVASIGKVATAALVMQEAERGLDLSTPVAALLPAAEIEGLFAGPGATVEQLLAHTSGVNDYFDGPVESGRPFGDELLADPDRAWSPADTLAFARTRQRPAAPPGATFRYSDTGYLLLGRIIEERTGLDLAKALRARVLEPAGMENTTLWQHEPGPERIAPLWFGDVEVSTYRCLGFDWAAGGLVATLDDLAALAAALPTGAIVTPESFARMRTGRNRLRRGVYYGLGLVELRFDEFAPFLRRLGRPVGGLGVSATHLFFDPARGRTIVLNFHSTRAMASSFITHLAIAGALARLG